MIENMPVLNYSKYIKDFPFCPKSVPMSLFKNEYCQKNHMQTAQRLAERGGLIPQEIICVILGIAWRNDLDVGKCIAVINQKVKQLSDK